MTKNEFINYMQDIIVSSLENSSKLEKIKESALHIREFDEQRFINNLMAEHISFDKNKILKCVKKSYK